jgi:hypothetical protein
MIGGESERHALKFLSLQTLESFREPAIPDDRKKFFRPVSD